VSAWTTARDLKAAVARLWERGDLLRALVTGEAMFPLRLPLSTPTSMEFAHRFEAARAWVAELAAVPRLRIEWREVNHRVLGPQRAPRCIWIDGLDDALVLIGKRPEAARFRVLVDTTMARRPELAPWLARRPLQALDLAGDWERLLDVVDWVALHPRPGVYLRQVDIPGVHSKFIEAHRGVLAEWLDLALPAQAIDATRSGAGQFAGRYGFLEKPARLRFRVLDPALALLPVSRGSPSRPRREPDVTLDAASFADLAAPIRRVFITENETNFLAFPPAAESIVVFGAGYGWDALAMAAWLTVCEIHYWGDIDTHGFAILAQLRARFGHVVSFLMDRATLMAHEALWGEEAAQVVHDLPGLTAPEAALFDDLRDNRIRRNLRLEQERVGFGRVRAALANVLGSGGGVA
jgi:hypothetical protein